MKNFLAVLTVGLVLITTSMDADAARRFGGGKSFGRPAPTLTQKAPQPAANPQMGQQQAQRPATAANPAAAAAAAKPSPWKGMLMGAAAALGITALLSALGLGEGFAQVIMMVLLAVVLFFAVRFVMGMVMGNRARTASASGMLHRGEPQAPRENVSHFEPVREPQPAQPTPASAMSGAATPGSVFDVFQNAGAAGMPELKIPEGFDAAGFEAVAKDNFVKLQKAWDTGNVIEISDFTTDDFFIEVTHKLRERDTKAQESEVVNLSAKLLGFVEGETENVAVVAFEGAMKIAGEFEQVNEHWVLVQKADGSTGWLLAGISQVEETVN